MRLLCLVFVCLLVGCQQTVTPTPAATRTLPTPAPISTRPVEASPLGGTLLVVEQNAYPNLRISQTDLRDLNTETLFEAPENGWINQIGLSPDGNMLVLAYTPPSPEGQLRLDRSGLFLLDLASPDAVLTPLLVPEEPNTYYYTPVWSASSEYIFYGETVIGSASVRDLDVTLKRLEVATGETIAIAKDGIWPRVSPDGSKLVFIQVDPETLERGLVVSELDGSDVQTLVAVGTFFDVDTPLFSADSQTVYFTVAREAPDRSRTWIDRLTGVRTAAAHANHNVPSAWWRIGADGEEMAAISAESDIILHGAIDTATDQLYFSTVTGLYVYEPASDTTSQIAAASHFRTIALRR